ncbi:hypothetical protein X943_001060 [Babesia divergens]|uniref:A-kinase anchor protein 7-like phosphoesterase domain-containing protein n=1 Tax=Babesia divergens TaxID=32595 RepID=A0AAD9GH97_BABDI|nr:hypothetical protein X943_001060 [Babesia divergens]
MGTIKGDVFRYETISIQKEGVEPPQYRTFRVPVAVESKLVIPEEDTGKEGKDDTDNEGQTSITPMAIQQNAIQVRMPFKAFIQRNIPELEKRMAVRLSLKTHNNSLVLMASGERSAEAIAEMLNKCRRSRVYNYYLCLPVRGREFHEHLDELKKTVKNCLGADVAYEAKPHITLALLNLVTDDDVDAVVKALQSAALAMSSLSSDPEEQKRPYSVKLSGVKSIKHKGKAARGSVFMTHATPEDTLGDIAAEFQESVKRTINQILLTTHKKIAKGRTTQTGKPMGVGVMTEAEAAAQGIYVTKGGNLEITYTDTAVVDPNGSISNAELNQLLAELLAKNTSFKGDTPHEKKGNTSKKGENHSQKDSCSKMTNQQHGTVTKDSDHHMGNVNYLTEEDGNSDEEFEEHETSVTHELHVTLLRHQHVERLKNIPFSCQGLVSCVELRPRGIETCAFNAYTKTRLVRFVGSRYDGKETEEHGVTQVAGSTKPDMPADLIADPGSNGALERFVFWI